MTRIRTMGLALIAVLAMSAIAATAAQAVEGPFFTIAGKRLLSGEKATLKNKAASAVVVRAGTLEISCSKLKLKAGAAILGSSGANPGTSEGTMEFESCTVTGNGTGCEVKGGRIESNPIRGLIGYQTERSGRMLLLLLAASGSSFATVNFVGTGCKVESTTIEGQVLGEVWSGGSPVEIGKEPEEAKTSEINFPKAAIKTISVESAGKLEKREAGLSVGKVPATLEGRVEMELESGAAFSKLSILKI